MLREQIMKEYHGGSLVGHFSGPRLYKTLARCWWWQHIYSDALNIPVIVHIVQL